MDKLKISLSLEEISNITHALESQLTRYYDYLGDESDDATRKEIYRWYDNDNKLLQKLDRIYQKAAKKKRKDEEEKRNNG